MRIEQRLTALPPVRRRSVNIEVPEKTDPKGLRGSTSSACEHWLFQQSLYLLCFRPSSVLSHLTDIKWWRKQATRAKGATPAFFKARC